MSTATRLFVFTLLFAMLAAPAGAAPAPNPAPATRIEPHVDTLRTVATPTATMGTPVHGPLYERELKIKAFRLRRNGKRAGGHADIYIPYTTDMELARGIYTNTGRAPSSGQDYTPVYHSRRPKKCKDTGCSGHDSDCRWYDAKPVILDDWGIGPNAFCNPVYAKLEFWKDAQQFNARKVGDCETDGSSIAFLNSPAPPASGILTSCEARSIQNTLHGKPGYVEYEWELKKDLFGAVAGHPSCVYDDFRSCGVVQLYQFGQPNACMLRCFMSLNSLDLNDNSALGTRDIYFLFDTDSNQSTGDPSSLSEMCGADYRVHITLSYSGGPPLQNVVLEKYNGVSWQTVPGGPIDLVIAPNAPSRTVGFNLLLSDIGNPSPTVTSWVVFAQNDVISGYQPCPPCDPSNRMAVVLGSTSASCPTVESVDDSGTHNGGTGAVVVTFSAPMQAISPSDLSLSPALPAGYTLHLAQTNANERLSLTVTPEWPAGHYQLTLEPTIKDCSGAGLSDPDVSPNCGVAVVRSFCTEESHLLIANASGTSITSTSFGANVYTKGSQFSPSTSYQVYLVQEDEFDTPNAPLVDFSSDGPNTVVTDAGGNLPLTNLGTPVAVDAYNVVVDVNGNGVLDSSDRVAVICGAGLEVGPPCADGPTEPPLLLWSLDQKTGVLAGERGEGLAGTVTGPFAWIAGRVDGAIALQSTVGNPAYVSVPSNPDLDVLDGDFSVAAWINTSASSGTILSHVGGTGVGYVLSLAGGVPAFTLNDGSGTSTFTTSSGAQHLDDGTWHLVTVTVERASTTGLKIWSDQTNVLTGDPTARQASISPGAPFVMGNVNPASGAAAFTGALDEVTLFDVPLTSDDVHGLFTEIASGGCLDSSSTYRHFPNPLCVDSTTIYQMAHALAYPFADCTPTLPLNALGDTLQGVAGVITAVDPTPPTFGFYMQNSQGGPWSGVWVFTGANNVGSSVPLAVGDSVSVEYAATENFQGGAELTSPNNLVATPDMVLRKVGSGHPLPPFHAATTTNLSLAFADTLHALQWQGTLVHVDGPLRVARVGAPLPTNVFYLVSNASLSDTLYVDGRSLATVSAPAFGASVDWVRGVCDHRSPGTILFLRGAGDMAAAGPPGLTDAYPLSDTQVRVTFDRAVTSASATNLANYALMSFGTVDAAVMDGASAAILSVTSPLNRGDLETLNVNGVTSLASGITMTSPQARSYVTGVLGVSEIGAPNPDSLAAIPCVDKSRFAGGGGRITQGDPGPRVSMTGVCTGIFGNACYFEDASPSGSGAHGGIAVISPPATIVVGRSYLLAGAVAMSFGETQLTSVGYVSDRGAVPLPGALPISVGVASLDICDATQTTSDGADFRGMLVRLAGVRVAPPVSSPFGFTVQGDAPAFDHSLFIENLANALGPYSASNLVYGAPGEVLNITGELHYESGTYRICPRDASDLLRVATGVGPGGGTLAFSFKVGPNPAFASQATPVNLSFTLPERAWVELGVFDLAGRRIATLLPAGVMPAGQYTNIHWSGHDDGGSGVEAGVYFYRLRCGDRYHTLRTVLLRRN